MLTAKYELTRIGEKGELQNLLHTPTTKIICNIFLALGIKKRYLLFLYIIF